MAFINGISMLAIALTIILLPNIAFATEYVVGDGKGWTTDFNYTIWAQDKMFNVGDSLVFQYDPTLHNVYKVNGTNFQECAVPLDVTPLTSGNDTIVLKASGKKWYICGKADHCSKRNQKLVINVMDMSTPAPAPSAAPRGINVLSGLQLFAAAIVSLIALN